jgi:rare lipoprotein A
MLLLREYTSAAACVLLVLAATAAQARTHSDTASFYSSGRVTASGERFDKAALKAAHPSLPFGSIVKVVNKRNGRSVVVEINDRGPAKWTRRSIDLTHGAARVIGMIDRGVVQVQLEVAPVTRRQLNRAFKKLTRMIEQREAMEAQPEVSADPTPQPYQVASAVATEQTYQVASAVAAEQPYQVASAVAAEIPRPLAVVGNVFKAYVESLVRPAGPHVRLTCADGTPWPEPLRVVLRRAAWEFDAPVEVVSGYRSLSHNRAVYGNRRKARGRYAGDGSQHIRCRAADIRIVGVSTARLHAWALHQPELGGVGRYRSDFIHVDVRPRPQGRVVSWDWRSKRKFARRHHRSHARA